MLSDQKRIENLSEQIGKKVSDRSTLPEKR